jgi:ATP-binding cassette, subfamily B, bacterial MsbA
MSIFRRFALYLKPHSLHIAAILLSTTLFVAFSSAAYWLAASFLTTLFSGELAVNIDDRSLNGLLKLWTAKLLVGGDTQTTLFRAAMAIVLSFFGKNLFGYLQLYYVSFVEQKVIKELRIDLFNVLLLQDLTFFQKRERGHLISAVLNDVDRLNIALNKSFTKIIRDPINALVILVLLFAVSWKLTFAALIVVPVIGWVVIFLAKKIKTHAVRVQEILARLTSHLQETISGVRIVKAFVAEDFESKRFGAITTKFFNNAFSQERLRRLVIPLNEFVGIIIISAILFVGGDLVLVKGTINSEDFIRFLVLLFALLNPLLSLSNLVSNIRLAEAAGDRVFELMDSVPQLEQTKNPIVNPTFSDSISYNRVSFSYSEELPDVLKDLDFKIESGQRVGIVGHSGSGKSTLINLIPRFFDPTGGSITIDGNDIRELKMEWLRDRFGIVTQQVILFHDTIQANIAYGLSGIKISEIENAAKAAYAHDFIVELPDGYNTIVGEQGSLLSGGQRQRISIARALLRDPDIVILDEATSALDPESEEAVSAALDTLTRGRTVIIVTHRLAAIKNADRIFVLDKGVICGSGLHSELINSCDVYRNLAVKQKLIKVPFEKINPQVDKL